jgi:predicted negative regulator of RcsB-dependent stress response
MLSNWTCVVILALLLYFGFLYYFNFRNEELKTYKDFKMAAASYQNAWQQLLGVNGAWEHKGPGYLEFT